MSSPVLEILRVLSRPISRPIGKFVSRASDLVVTIGGVVGGLIGLSCAGIAILTIGLPEIAPAQIGFGYCVAGVIVGVLAGCLIAAWGWPLQTSLRTPQFYPENGDSKTRQARAALQKNDWRPAAALFASITNTNDLSFLIDLIVESPCPRAPIEAWTEEQPDSGLAWLVRGIHSTSWAWEARGRGTGSTVTLQGAIAFRERLRFSVQELTRAAKLRPQDPLPWGYLIRAALGLDDVREKLDYLLEQARLRDPQAFIPHACFFTNKCAKWFGSHDAMFAFVRHVSDQAGEGSDLHVLIPMAHMERHMSYYWDDDREQGDAYFSQPKVRGEILQAYQRSIGSPKYVAHPATVEYRNHFVLCLYECALNQFAQKELALIDGHLSRLPWIYYNDPPAYYQKLLRNLQLG